MSVVFFTDRDLGKRFPDLLEAAGLNVERHHDLFSPECPDELWLEYVGKNGRVAITHDGCIRYKPNEIAAVLYHRVALLVVVGKAPIPLLGSHFVRTMPRISAFLAEHEAPFIARVIRPSPAELAKNPNAFGTVSLSYPR